MSKAIQLQIPEPCHEKWHNMTPEEQGRFCGSCQKTVVDFTLMSDKEILDHISKAGQHVCGRFSNDQLNKDLKPTEIKKRFSWAYIWNIVVATFLITEANAQVKPVKKQQPEMQLPEQAPTRVGKIALVDEATPPRELKGTVIDSNTKQPLANASITIIGTSTGTISDSLGNFRLMIDKDKDEPFDLAVSYIGYNTRTLTVDGSTNWQDLKVVLPEVSYKHITLGMVVVAHKKTKKKTINDWKPAVLKKDIKVYPNPVIRGSNIHASLSLKQAGEYKLELLNMQGELMTIQRLTMATTEQVATIPTQGGWAPGIYWMRVSAPGVRNVYQCKVSIQ
jgi:hypothetical protein